MVAKPKRDEAAPRGSSKDFTSTADIPLPKDPLERVIGQERAVELARIAARQRRHLLLVGPPGTGKSMIAQAIALHLELPKTEVLAGRNPENPDGPFIEGPTREEMEPATPRASPAARA